MAVFVAPQKDIQVNHDCVDAILTCMKRHRVQREEILDKYDYYILMKNGIAFKNG